MRWLKLVRLDTVNDYQYVSVTISYSGTYRILMESAGRTVWLLTYQNSKKWAQRTSEISDTKTTSTFHVVLRRLYTYWNISHFSRLFISKLSKILKFARWKCTPWNDKENEVSAYYCSKTFVKNVMRVRIWGNLRIASTVVLTFCSECTTENGWFAWI